MTHLYVRGTLAERLWARVDKDGPVVKEELGPCWIYLGGHNKLGRGQIGVSYPSGWRMELVHRVAWELEHGPIREGIQILHHCDTPDCCRDSHLYEGNYAANAEDCSSRGRRSGGKTVTREIVLSIRAKHAEGISQYRLAKEFGITATSIGSIVHRRTWVHV